MLLLLAACWSPDPGLAPELPPLDDEGFVATADDAAPEGPDAPPDGPDAPPDGAPDDAPDGADDGTDDGADDGADDAAPPFDTYVGYTTAAPVSIVDDYGKPLAIVQKLGTEVEVRGEDDIRRKVWCATCVPATEGWVQRVVVTDRGQGAPRSATVLPPGAPRPGLPLGG